MRELRRHISWLLAFILIISCVMCYGASAAAEPTIFVGDEPWSGEARYPWYLIDGEDYLAAFAFTAVDGITISKNDNLKNVMLSMGEWYMTFDYSNDYVYTYKDGVNDSYEMMTGRFHGLELYVPAAKVAEFFGLKYERADQLSSWAGETVAVRIRSSSAKLTFEKLLRAFSPSVLIPEDTSEIVTPPSAATMTAHLALCVNDKDGVGTTLELLSRHEAKATFFLAAEVITENPDTVGAILSAGHAVGIIARQTDDIKALLDGANASLFAAFKIMTRLVLIDGEYPPSPEDIAAAGYSPRSIPGDRSVTDGGYTVFTVRSDGAPSLLTTLGWLDTHPAFVTRVLTAAD